MSRHFFITGSSGFLGNHLAEAARRAGHKVTGLDLRLGGATTHVRDIADIWGSDLLRVDTLVHFAAYTSLVAFEQGMEKNYQSNVSSFITLLEAARYAGVRKLVYASSSAVYMDGRGTNFREDEPIDHTRLVSHYGKTKLIDELIAKSYADAFGMNILGLRYFNVYGPGDELKIGRCAPVQHFVNSRLAGEAIVIYEDGEQAKDFIHVDDAIACTMKLIEADARGICNIGTGVATSFNRLAEIIGGHAEHVPHPSPFGYMYYTRADMTKLRKVIGDYRFIDIETGIARMLEAPVCA